MTPERWQQVQRVLQEVIDLPAHERMVHLERSCGDDRELYTEVQGLMAALDQDPDFLNEPLVRVTALPVDGGEGSFDPSDRIGAFEIVRPLGRGGMGEVYLANQASDDFVRQVALKVIRRGMDTDDVLRRFATERRILASLQHPHIAQLHDAGATDDGRPFFAMEFVDGTPIHRFAERHRLPVEARLRLFQAVCGAVQYAHQNLVVHRDIKPGNVLVTADGIPKLLDFGIGKVLTDQPDGPQTQTRSRMLTPEYAAPEQVRGENVTTATDVYGLGVLLFELLTGQRPFDDDGGSYESLARAICETPASRPSTVPPEPDAAEAKGVPRSRLRGDLDTIVLMALRKEPERRYASAAAFAEDIDRYLNGLPVRAQPDSLAYRSRKFIGRNGWAVAAGSAVVIGLVATTLVTTVQSRRIANERDKAQEVQSFLLETFGASSAEGLTGDSVTVRQLLDRQSETVATAYQGQPELQAEMYAVLADAYERLGIYSAAARQAKRSLDLRRDLYSGNHVDVAHALNLLGWIRHQEGASEEAVQLLEQSVDMWRRLGPDERETMSRALNDLAVVYDARGDMDRAEPLFVEALDIRREVLGEHHRSVGITSSNLAVLYYRRGQYQAADSLGQIALDALRAAVGPDHQRSVIAQGNLGAFRMAAGDLEGAEALQEDLLDRQTRIQGRRHPQTASVMVNYANILRERRELEDAEGLLREALSIQEETLGRNHPRVGATLRVLGAVLSLQLRYAEALPVLQRGVEVSEAAFGQVHLNVGAARLALALGFQRAERTTDAVNEYRRAIGVLDGAVGENHPRSADARLRLGALLLTNGQPAAALPWLAEANRLAASLSPPVRVLMLGSQLRMADAHLQLGQPAVADSIARGAEVLMAEGDVSAGLRERAQDLRARLDSITSIR